MKQILFRHSGEPVTLEAREKYEKDFKVFYDKAAARAGLDMLKLQRFMSFGERQLLLKHGTQVEVDLPKNGKAWKSLLSKYEDVPIMVALSQNRKKLVLILMDTLS